MASTKTTVEEAAGCAIVIGTFIGFPFAFVSAWYQEWFAFSIAMAWMIGWIAAAYLSTMRHKH